MDPFVAEVRAFGFNFAPKGWAFCNGQLMDISQNTALFSLLGTFYGGDGKSSFALPNMQGNLSNSQGQLAGSGSQYFVGQTGGEQNVTLLTSEMPVHNHNLLAANFNGDSLGPAQGALAKGKMIYTALANNLVPMNPSALAVTGQSFPHNNMMPYLCLNFCIAVQGIYPSRS